MPDKDKAGEPTRPPSKVETTGAEPIAAGPVAKLHQALAGALPKWDLVPTSVFVRRH